MVYVIEAGDFIKIGVADNLTSRLKSLQVGNPLRLRPLRQITTKDRSFDLLLEKFLHARYKNAVAPANNEWFYKQGCEELLSANKEMLISIAHAGRLDGSANICHITGFSNEISKELNGYLDTKTLTALTNNCIFSFEDLDRFLNSGTLAPGIGDVRYANIKEAYQKYKEER